MIQYIIKKRYVSIFLYFILTLVGLFFLYLSSDMRRLTFLLFMLLGVIFTGGGYNGLTRIFNLVSKRKTRFSVSLDFPTKVKCSPEVKSLGFRTVNSDQFDFLYSSSCSDSLDLAKPVEFVKGMDTSFINKYYDRIIKIASVQNRSRFRRSLFDKLVPQGSNILGLCSDDFCQTSIKMRSLSLYDDIFSNQSVDKSLNFWGKTEISSISKMVEKTFGEYVIPTLDTSEYSNGLRLICLFQTSDNYIVSPKILYPSRLCEYSGDKNAPLRSHIHYTLNRLLGPLGVTSEIELLGYARIGFEGFAPAIGLRVSLPLTASEVTSRVTSLSNETLSISHLTLDTILNSNLVVLDDTSFDVGYFQFLNLLLRKE